jgi:hypothetical protein
MLESGGALQRAGDFRDGVFGSGANFFPPMLRNTFAYLRIRPAAKTLPLLSSM